MSPDDKAFLIFIAILISGGLIAFALYILAVYIGVFPVPS